MSVGQEYHDRIRASSGKAGSTARFGPICRLNHWTGAALFLGALGLGFFIANSSLPREAVGPWMQWHKALGVMVLVFGVWRVGWRMAQGFPPPKGSMPRWQTCVAKAVHVGLLVAILAMPLSGVAMTLAAGRDLAVWDVTLLSSPGKIAWLDGVAGAIHALAPPLILLLLALHIGGALKHRMAGRGLS